LENTPLHFTYSAHLFANGNIFASAGIQDVGLAASYANLYSPRQNGAVTAPVNVTFDEVAPSNGGWWRISLNRATLVTTIVYNDVDVAGGTQTWTMQPANCVVNSY
jgi:hypothetical protein